MANKKDKSAAIEAFKGFDPNLQCRGYQFEVGRTETHKGLVEACGSGFHACTYPLDVLTYYPFGEGNRYARVVLSGTTSTHSADSKIAAEHLLVTEEIKIGGLITASLDFLFKDAKINKGDSSTLAASGDSSMLAASGNYSKLAASGDSSTLAASGYGSKAKAGENGAIALAYSDGTRPRFAVGYVGEDGIKADTWYAVDSETGKLVEVAE